jgi:hypothetical protein
MPTRRRRKREPRQTDRRHTDRFPLANTDIGNHSIRGRVLDLSRAGMAIETQETLRPGQSYELTLTIGEHVETLEARVLWCRLCGTRPIEDGDIAPVYRAGIVRIRPETPGEDEKATE